MATRLVTAIMVYLYYDRDSSRASLLACHAGRLAARLKEIEMGQPPRA